ncbi:MAG TPA: hypothetical protein VM308_08595 [Sphingomicrobium sp.]|nr:hypothetical protein [Sphingomicrobium sp.]
MRRAPIIAMLALSACAAPGGPYPSLQPRAAEQIDPRLPVVRPVNQRPVTSALASRLDALVAQARAGDASFAPAIAAAERLAAAAGAKGSESWTVAQEALSAAVEARSATTAALGDIDAIAATALETQGGIAPSDLAAIQSAAAEAAAIEQRQAARIRAIQGRLGG